MAVGTHLFQRGIDRDAERLKRRNEPGSDARDERDDRGEHDHAPVGRHGQIDWTAVEKQIEQPLAHTSGKREAGGTTKRSEHEALGQKLTHESSASGTDRETNRNLSLPRGRTCEQQP